MARLIRADRTGPAILPAALADARAQARAIVQRAEARAEAQRDQSLAQARAQARAELAADLVRLAQERDRQLAALEPQAIQLALLAARRIIGEELAARPERVAELVAPLLARVRSARQVTLRVHPDDQPLLESGLGGTAPALRGGAALGGTAPALRGGAALAEPCAGAELSGGVRIEADPALGRGDCIVVSDAGVLDARIEVQLQALARALGVG
jgi:flagellar biosynthesis/type III secretory pathway protein FliH